MPTPVPDAALCLSCNYSLRGLDSRHCPECGRAFDPDQPRSMNLGRPLDAVAVTLLQPMGRWARVTMWSLAAAGALGPAWLVPSRAAACVWLALWGAFIFVCWGRSAARRTVDAKYRQGGQHLRVDDALRTRTRWVFVVVTFLILTRAPFFLALYVSRPWLDADARHIWMDLPADVQPQQGPRMRGLVLVKWIDAGGAHVTFVLYGGGCVEYVTTPDSKDIRWGWETFGWDEW